MCFASLVDHCYIVTDLKLLLTTGLVLPQFGLTRGSVRKEAYMYHNGYSFWVYVDSPKLCMIYTYMYMYHQQENKQSTLKHVHGNTNDISETYKITDNC